MSRFSIYSSDGLTVRYSGKPKYNGSYLNVSYIEFSEICSPRPIAWAVGDYVDYARIGLRFKLYSIPQPKKQARTGTAGDAYVYSNVKLYEDTKELDVALFNDIVAADNGIHFSSRSSISTFENVYGIAERIQACMDEFYPDRWTIKAMTLADGLDAETVAVMSEAKDFTLDNGTCLGALSKIYSTWETIGWIHTLDSVTGKNVITIGRPNVRTADNTTSPFLYGKGNGLTAIKKSYTNSEDFATRIYAFGSEKNMPSRYYNGKDILNAESVDIPNLMLPISTWGTTDNGSGVLKPDARLAYIQDAAKTASYGLIPKKIYFDGSDNNEDIYPSIKNMTVGKLRSAKTAAGDTAYIPNSTIYAVDTERLDLIKSAANPEDTGLLADDGASFNESDEMDVAVNQTFTNGDSFDILLASANLTGNGMAIATFGLAKGYLEFTSWLPSALSAKIRISSSSGVSKDFDVTFALGITLVDNLPVFTYSFNIPTVTISGKNVAGTIEVRLIGSASRVMITDPNTESPISDETGGLKYNVLTDSCKATIGVRYDLEDTFALVIKQIGFDIASRSSQSSDGIATIKMIDGMCAGRAFSIQSCTYQSATDDWLLYVKRTSDDSTGMAYPNSSYQIMTNDKFVLTDLSMPELYITVAEETLLDAANAAYLDSSNGKSYYEPSIDAKQVAINGETLREGMYMELTDTDIIDGGTDYIIIDSLSIDENESSIPTYSVTLKEKKKQSYAVQTSSAIADILGKIEVISRQASGTLPIISSTDKTQPSDGNVFSALRSRIEHVSKTYDDEAKGLITFNKGIKCGNFASGVSGFGGYIDGKGAAELDSLTLRRSLIIPSIQYNRSEIFVGNQWRSNAGGVIEKIAADFDANGNILTSGTITLHLEDGEIGQFAVDDICQGIFHDAITPSNNANESADDGKGNFKFAGFFTCYFRVTEILNASGSQFKYSLRPTSTNWATAFHPTESMTIVQYGNFSNTARQSSRYSTLTYERYLKDVADWEITANNIGAQFGDLSNLSVFGLNMTGYSAYLNNIYMSGVIKQIEEADAEIEVETDGNDFLSVGESVEVSWKVMKGFEDVTSQYDFSITRDSGNAQADNTWNTHHYFPTNPLTLHKTDSSDSDIVDGVNNVFTIEYYIPLHLVNKKNFVIHNKPLNGTDGISNFLSVVFMRSATQPTTPTGGTYASPKPTDTEWTDGIPNGDGILWSSTCKFSSDGDNGSWSVPAQMTDTASLDIIWSSEAAPTSPTGHPNTNTQWSGAADSTTLWMATSKCANGEWGSWEVSKIKGETGDKGDTGSNGLQGMIVRTSEWAAGVDYHNDEGLTDAVRYLDIAIVTTGVNSFTAYQCKLTHTSSASIPVTNSTYWQEFNTLAPVYTPLIMAQNALLRFAQTNQLLVMKSDGTTVAAGMGGGTYPIWAGAALPENAPFRVAMDGTVYGTKMNISGDSIFSGTLNAVTGSFLSLDCRDSNNNLVGYIHFNASNNNEIEFSTDGFFSFYGDINTHYGDINISGTKATSDGTNIDRPVRLISRDLWCKGTFGAAKRASIIVKGAYVRIYPYGLDDSRYTTYYLTSVSASPNYYLLPCRYTIDSESDGFAVDTIIFITSADYNYVFSNMAVSQKITLVNANGNQSVHYYRNGSIIELRGGVGLQIKYLGNLLSPTTSGLGAGIMSLGYEDISW